MSRPARRGAAERVGGLPGLNAGGARVFASGRKCFMCMAVEGVDEDARTMELIILEYNWCQVCRSA
jgi:hypothetical protein